MWKQKFALLSILLVGLVVSGCTGQSDETPGNTNESLTNTATPAPDPAGDIMDSEISTIESDLTFKDRLKTNN